MRAPLLLAFLPLAFAGPSAQNRWGFGLLESLFAGSSDTTTTATTETTTTTTTKSGMFGLGLLPNNGGLLGFGLLGGNSQSSGDTSTGQLCSRAGGKQGDCAEGDVADGSCDPDVDEPVVNGCKDPLLPFCMKTYWEYGNEQPKCYECRDEGEDCKNARTSYCSFGKCEPCPNFGDGEGCQHIVTRNTPEGFGCKKDHNKCKKDPTFNPEVDPQDHDNTICVPVQELCANHAECAAAEMDVPAAVHFCNTVAGSDNHEKCGYRVEVNCQTVWYQDVAGGGKLAGPMLIIRTYPPGFLPNVFQECHFHLGWSQESLSWEITTNNCPYIQGRTKVQPKLPLLRSKASELCGAELLAIPSDAQSTTGCWTPAAGINKGQFDLYKIQEKQLASTDLRGKIQL